jgi:hypothetical protein
MLQEGLFQSDTSLVTFAASPLRGRGGEGTARCAS